MIGKARRFLREENGASAAEYVLLLAIIGGGAAIAAVTMGDSIGGSLSLSSLIIADAGASDGAADPGPTGASSPDPRQSAGGQGAGQDGDAAGQGGAAGGQNGCTPGQDGHPHGKHK